MQTEQNTMAHFPEFLSFSSAAKCSHGQEGAVSRPWHPLMAELTPFSIVN